MAWGVLWASFAALCVVAVSLFLAVRWYEATATDGLDLKLKVVRGTVLIQESRRLDWVAASDGMDLTEGYRIRTDGSSQALLNLKDGTQINLFPDSEMAIGLLKRLRFNPQSFAMNINYKSGKLRIEVGGAGAYRRDYHASAPAAGATVALQEGSFTIDSTGDTVEMKVQDGGRATARAMDRDVEVRSGQRIQLVSGQPPSTPVAAAREMVVNGRFQDGLSRWASGNKDFPPKSTIGTVEIVPTELGNAVKLARTNSNATHAETFLHQDINQDVADFRSLSLFLQLKLNMQSLSGGGYVGSEYPLMVKVYYRTEKGDNVQVYGFYYQNDTDNLTLNGTQLPQGEWVSYVVPQNLMAVDPPPVRILWLEITASGHDYESLAKEISLEGE
ncbi:MAG: FecR domain-containing protein [Dehalococcoidia bacterium]|nr:FecR domain-containing protein [Dehalococcoidia bacterium]